jgi:hypothetical protein
LITWHSLSVLGCLSARPGMAEIRTRRPVAGYFGQTAW